MVDVIILSNARTPELKKLTQQTIDSCNNSDSIDFNIICFEQQKHVVYNGCDSYYIDLPFNYNHFMNIGIQLSKSKYVCLCNNDLIFSKGWASNIINAMEANRLLSACPAQTKGTGITYGYRNNHELNGWCIMTNRKLYSIIGEIDSEFPFWFADNIYSEQLKRHNIKHAVVNNSVVKHLGSSTLNTLEANLQHQYTYDTVRRFIEKHPLNESAIHFKRFM